MVRRRVRALFDAVSVRQALALLPEQSRRKFMLLAAVQFALGLLDLISIGLVGLIGTLAVTGVQSQQAGGLIGSLLNAAGLSQLSFQTQVAVLGVLAAAMFMARTAASIFLIRRALHFLAARSAEVSASLGSRVMSSPLLTVQAHTTQELLFSVTNGTNNLVLGVLGTLVSLVADTSMLLAVSVLLFSASPIVALASGALLLVLVRVLHASTVGRAAALGREGADLDVASRELFAEAIATYRDVHVRNAQPLYARSFGDLRRRAAHVSAENSFIPNVSKYVMEAAVVIGALLVAGLEFSITDAQTAVGTLAMFLAAGMRLAPAVMRLQQGAIGLKAQSAQGARALELIRSLPQARELGEVVHFTDIHPGFEPTVQWAGVSFTYPGAERPALERLDLGVRSGEFIGIAGPSGAGKSTMTDLLLGVLTPDEGTIELSGLPAVDAIRAWPGAIAYVPQDVWITAGTIRDNVALGFPHGDVPDDAVWSALRVAHLDEYVRALPQGLDTPTGERGARLSGGQRQRLGIARAIVTQPRLLVLDEATSALDTETEHLLNASLHELRERTTIIVVAHRLVTIREADRIIYIEGGRVLAQGDFAAVRAAVPEFERQVQLSGLGR